MKIGFFDISKHANISHRIVDNEIKQYFGLFFKTSSISPNANPDEILKWTETNKIHFVLLNDVFDPINLLRHRNNKKIHIGFLILPYIFYPWASRFRALAPHITDHDVFLSFSDFLDKKLDEIRPDMKRFRFPLPIDTRNIKPPARNKDSIYRIVYCGRIIPEKNIHVIISLLPLLRSKHPTELHVVGEMNQANPYARHLQGLVNKLGLRPFVQFHGSCEQWQTRKMVLSQGDILVHPTTDPGETFGRVIVEAFACGLAVITTNWFGVNELVNHGVNGFLIPIRGKKKICEKKLLEKIYLLQNDKKLLSATRTRNRQKAATYDYRIIMKHLKSYLAALN